MEKVSFEWSLKWEREGVMDGETSDASRDDELV